MTLSDGSTYYTKGINYTHGNITLQEGKSHTYTSFVNYPTKSVLYDLLEPTRLEFYLHRSFVRDLRRLPAVELVARYGTHLVTYYTTGAYMKLVLSAKASLFTAEEVARIEEKLCLDKARLSRELKDKIKRNTSGIAIVYKQGGSNYMPNRELLGLGGFYQDTSTPALSEEQWLTKLRPNDNNFISLAEDGQGLVPIANLISDIPLKIKYVSGILHRTQRAASSAISYVLCEPKSLKPFTFKGMVLRVGLSSYADAVEQLMLGTDQMTLFTEGLITGTDQQNGKWNVELGEDGLWTVSSRLTKKYLCTDGALRTIAEDAGGLRYWLLNPIIPTPDGNTRKLSQLFIQPKV